MGDLFSTGKSSAQRAQKKQEELIARQKQTEEAGKAETEDELARRRALAESGRGGRRSLIRTSETGTRRENLG